MNLSNQNQSQLNSQGAQRSLLGSSMSPDNSQCPLWHQSASTWRNTTPNYSFPKGDRFNIYDKTKRKVDSTHEDSRLARINLPSQLSSKSCTQGKGFKQYMTFEEMRRAKENPAPGHTVKNLVKAPSIQNISVAKGDRFFKNEFKLVLPSVGSYEVSKPIGQGKMMVELKSRGKTFSDHQVQGVPSPNQYNVTSRITSQSRFNKISFGKGDKYSFQHYKMNDKVNKFVPGPGYYNTGSKFDKFNKGLEGWVSPLQKAKIQQKKPKFAKNFVRKFDKNDLKVEEDVQWEIRGDNNEEEHEDEDNEINNQDGNEQPQQQDKEELQEENV